MRSRALAIPNNLRQQPLRLPLHRQNIRPNLRQRPHRLGLIEISGEADLVAGPHAVRLVPGVSRVGQNLTPQERFDAAFLLQRNLLGVAQIGVRFVFHHDGSAVDGSLEPAAQRVGLRASLVDILDDWRRGFAALANAPSAS